MNRSLLIVVSNVFYVLLFLVDHALAKSDNNILYSRAGDHDEIVSLESPLLDRKLQALISNVGERILPHSTGLSDLDLLLLDSARVDVFHSSQNYIYITRGLLMLLRNEGHVACALAFEVARMERKWSSRSKYFKRVIRILDNAGYSSDVLLEFVQMMSRYNLYMKKRVDGDKLFTHSYRGLSKADVGRIQREIRVAQSTASIKRSRSYLSLSETDFISTLDGLAIDDVQISPLINANSQTFKAEDFVVFFPKKWTVFKGKEVLEELPFKSAILNYDESSRSVITLRSPIKRKLAMEVSLVVVDKPADLDAGVFLHQHLEGLSKKMRVVRETPIKGDFWQGYLIEGRIWVEFKGEIELLGHTTDIATFSYLHLHALVPLNDKMIIVSSMASDNISSKRTIISGANSDYSEISRGMFSDIVTSISEGNTAVAAHRTLNKYSISTHVVSEGETIEILSAQSSIENAADKIRILNGMSGNEEFQTGQTVKLIISNL